MFTFLYNTFYFFVAVVILVTFHEYGHFQVARWLGIKVLQFSVGFGRVLYKVKDRLGTEYCLSAIPFGGFVKMLDEREGPVAAEDTPYTFNRAPVWKRTLIVLAGPAANIVFAFVAFYIVFLLGVHRIIPVVAYVKPNSIAQQAGIRGEHQFVSVNGQSTPGWLNVRQALLEAYKQKSSVSVEVRDFVNKRLMKTELDLSKVELNVLNPSILSSLGIHPVIPHVPNTIKKVVADSPASRAGIKDGDFILKINDAEVKSWNDMSRYIRVHPDIKTYKLLLGRGDQQIEVVLTPEVKNVPGIGEFPMMGIISATAHYSSDMLTIQRFGPVQSLWYAGEKTAEVTWLTIKLLTKFLTGQVSVHAVSGPVGIAITAGNAAKTGIVDFLEFLGLISVSLAVINLLPLPVLDGGHLLFYLIETIRGKPMSDNTQRRAIEVGLYLILGLMVVVSINDIMVKALH